MYVNTNVAALNAWQNLLNTQNSMTTTMQQLSSGYKINNAADNPAGLAISEQMQSQIDGLNQAYQNAQTGISMLQTTDGALSQIQNILQSMYSLATQAANSTNVGVDRGSIQSQMDQYTAEIDSITNQTAFNTKNLLDGVLGTVNLAVGADPSQELQFQLGAADAVSLGVAGLEPLSAAYTNTTTATSAADAGIGSPSLFLAGSATNPYGSYGLTGTTYALVLTGAQLATATINGSSLTPVTSTATVAGNDTSNASSLGLTTTAGSIQYDALTSTATTTESVMLQVQQVTTWASGGTSPTATTYNVLYSTNGGSSWTTLLTTTSTTGITGTYALGNTGVSLNLSKLSAPSVTGTASAAGTVTATDAYSISVDPQSATLELQTASGTAIGSPITVTGTAPSVVTVGSPNDGQAVGVSLNLATLLSSTDAAVSFNSTTGAMSSSPLALNFAISYASNNAATGSGGDVTQKAVVNAGLSVMNYAQATQAQEAITAALTQVSAQRAQVGSLIDRLNQASQDLNTSQLNLTSARGTLMDTDMALAMAQLSQEQVLQQSGVGMLAQANAIPQALLKLIP
jgi:flagellin